MREFTSRAERRRGEAVLARAAHERARSVAVPLVPQVEAGEGVRAVQDNAAEEPQRKVDEMALLGHCVSASEAIVTPEAESPGSRSLTVVSRESGVMALAYMSEADFGARLMALKQGQDRVRLIQRELMVKDEDYGVIPGTKKPTLMKPGAEKLCNIYGLVPTFQAEWIEGDGVTTPHLRCRMKCFMHRGDAEGSIVGEGVGTANTWEKKHRYRGAQKSCPSCGCEGTIRRSSFEKNGDRGWYCHAKAGGCGDNFLSNDTRITEQVAGQVENPDPYDVENTLFKMAKKRAQVDATLNATATSGLFTQDLEDMGGVDNTPATSAHEPGEDEPDMVQLPNGEWVRIQDPQRASAAGAEPNPTYDPHAQPEPRRHQARAATPVQGSLPPCPHCGNPARPSKFPKAGQTHYCYDCKHPFAPENDR